MNKEKETTMDKWSEEIYRQNLLIKSQRSTKKTVKQFIACGLAIVLSVGLLPVTSFANEAIDETVLETIASENQAYSRNSIAYGPYIIAQTGTDSVAIEQYVGREKDITIPSTVMVDGRELKVTKLKQYVFSSNDNVDTITVPEGITNIDDNCFASCSVKIINLPASFDYIPECFDYGGQPNCFSGAYELMAINIAEGNPVYCSVDGVLYNKDKTKLYFYPPNKQDTEFVVRAPVSVVHARFENTTNLQIISYSDSVKRADAPEGRSIKTVNIGKGLEKFYNWGDCGSTISDSVEQINVDEMNPVFSSEAGVLYNKDKTKLLMYPANRDEAIFFVPDSVVSVGTGAFDNCTKTIEVIFQQEISRIDSSAFIEDESHRNETTAGPLYVFRKGFSSDGNKSYYPASRSVFVGNESVQRVFGYYSIDPDLSLLPEYYFPSAKFVYNGKPIIPSLSDAKSKSEEGISGLFLSYLPEGIACTIDYADNVNAGTGKIIITGIGELSGSCTIPFTIEPRKLDSRFELDRSETIAYYDGKPCTPKIIVYDSRYDKLLQEDVNYTVQYNYNDSPSTHGYATITGIGNYCGELQWEFDIDYPEDPEGGQGSNTGNDNSDTDPTVPDNPDNPDNPSSNPPEEGSTTDSANSDSGNSEGNNDNNDSNQDSQTGIDNNSGGNTSAPDDHDSNNPNSSGEGNGELNDDLIVNPESPVVPDSNDNTIDSTVASPTQDNSNTALKSGIWVKNSIGWWYRQTDGSYPSNKWSKINGSWYYFNKSGYMQTGWLQQDKNWYYLKSSGAMATGWQQVNNTWYYMNDSGVMQTGWQKIGGTWYYFNNSGAMVTGWLQKGNAWYYLKPSGAMATGWVSVGGTWYYMNGSGIMQTGWQQIDDNWYHLKSSGAMQTGWYQVGSKWYYSNASGVMQTNRWIGSYWVGESGAMATNTTVDGGRYRVGPDGLWLR